MTSKAEQETIYRWDQDERVAHLYTAALVVRRYWERMGYDIEVVSFDAAGEPTGWQSTAPIEAIRLRRLVNGRIVKRAGGRGRPFQPSRPANRRSSSTEAGEDDVQHGLTSEGEEVA